MIPLPVQVSYLPGAFSLTPEMLDRWRQHGVRSFARLSLIDNPELGAEGYELSVNPDAVEIKARTPAGHFYAGQTLRQLVEEDLTIPCQLVRDWPRFKWRGMHLDVVRHFFPVEFIKRYLDILALHKLNVFHWHLTDDQGWRIEIEKYPRLTSVGAWRVDREGIPWNEREPQRDGEVASYGGFYTQNEIAEIVAYARDRFIEIVPEIEMPAHVLAALAAHPELSCTGGPFTVATGQYWPETDLLCAGKEQTFDFLRDVLTEVSDLFPGAFIHIGGDEADVTEWSSCPQCQQRMQDEGIDNPGALQGYFTRRVCDMLKDVGKRPVGWDEILNGNPDSRALIMSWRGSEHAIGACRAGHEVVMTPSSHLYFDHYQNDPAVEPQAFGGFSPLDHVYSFDPVPDELNQADAQHIIGAQANLWTEYVPTAEHAEYMALPRMAALAERVWSPRSSTDWPAFQIRMNRLLKLYDELGYHHASP
jgi:hexosaminidase